MIFNLSVVIALFFLALLHGAGDYQNIALVTYGGFSGLVLILIYFLKSNAFRLNIYVFILILLLSLIMIWATTQGLVRYQTKVGVSFFISNVFAMLFFSQLIMSKDFGVATVAEIFVKIGWMAGALGIVLFFMPVELLGYQFGRENYFRLVGTFSTPNRFGEAVGVASLASLYLLAVDKAKNKLKHFLFFIIMVMLTLASGSKGVILSLIVGVVIFVVGAQLLVKKYFIYPVVVLAPFICAFLIKFFDFFMHALKLDIILEGRLDIGSGRPDIWRTGKEIFFSGDFIDIFFGYGVSGFFNEVGKDAHNAYWDILFNYGVVGLLFTALLFTFPFLFLMLKLNLRNLFAVSLVSFCIVRGLSMPTILNGFSISMLSLWSAVSILICTFRGCEYGSSHSRNVSSQR